VRRRRFQYQKGAIKTFYGIPLEEQLKPHFNTKKVRLKRHATGPATARSLEFQYQKGAIKTRKTDRATINDQVISIPKRCD